MNLNPTQHKHIQVLTDLDALDQVVAWFEQFRDPPIPAKVWLEAQLALIESFTNVVRHAHLNQPPNTPIDIDIHWAENWVQFQVWDCGDEYAFESAMANLAFLIADPAFDPLERETQWGGIIFLTLRRKHNWIITYERRESKRNCFVAEKSF